MLFAGCTVKVTPLDLDAHIAVCEYNQPETSSQPEIHIPCSFKPAGCKETFDSQDEMNQHLNNDTQSHMNVRILFNYFFCCCNQIVQPN